MSDPTSTKPKSSDEINSAIFVSPWGVISKALEVAPKQATVIVVILASFAAVAIIGTWVEIKSPELTLRVFGVGAASYFGLAVLASLRGILSRILAWFLAIVFMVLTSVAVGKVIFKENLLPGVSVYCLYMWLDRGCYSYAIPLENIAEAPVEIIGGQDNLGPDNPDVWLSINRFDPWTKENAQDLKGKLQDLGWSVHSKAFPSLSTASNVLEVRYSDTSYRNDAIKLAAILNEKLVNSEPDKFRVVDLSDTIWKDEDHPSHIEIWVGK